jgi:hypothetical protein
LIAEILNLKAENEQTLSKNNDLASKFDSKGVRKNATIATNKNSLIRVRKRKKFFGTKSLQLKCEHMLAEMKT